MGTSRTLAVNPEGFFSLQNLLPGTYDISSSAPGFAEAKRQFTIARDVHQTLNIVLENENSSAKSVITSKSVSDLPLNGRSASDLATLEPGVATARTQTSGQGQRGFGTQMVISGGRPRQNDSRLDGISVNDYVNGPPGSALGLNLGSDSVEQFTVLSSNYPAQFGRSSGGIIGTSTHLGTSNFHGDIFEYIRNSAFDARNFFDSTKPPFLRNQFGGSLGGPILKDRTFFFADYEGLRQSQGITQVDTVPSQAARDGHLCNLPDCSTTGMLMVDPEVARFLKAFYPLPNGPLLCPFSSCVIGTGDTGIFRFAGETFTTENYFTTRVDQNISARDTLAGTYMFDTATVNQPDEMDNKRSAYETRRQLLALHEGHAFSPASQNSLRFGINRVVVVTGETFETTNAAAGDSSYGTVPGQNAAAVSVPGLTTFSGGLGTIDSYDFHWTSIQFYDDLEITRGNHLLKFGAGIERIRDNVLATTAPGGSFSFNSLSDFLTNHPFSLAATIPSSISERGFRQTILDAYFQDDWRWRQDFVLDLGLRYETATVPTEVQGKLTVLRHLTDPAPHLGVPLFSNPTLRNFEPRLGFSWTPFHDGKSIISGGFGVFDVLPLPYVILFDELFSAPFYDFGTSTNLPVGSYPTAAFSIVAASPNTFRQAYFDPHPHRNYVMRWNLAVRHQIGQGFEISVGYVGSRGVHQLFRVEDADIVLPALTSEGYLWPSPVGSGTRLNLNSGRIVAAFWEGNSYYDALQVQAKKRIARGFQIEGSYTWGKTIDTSSGSLVGDEYSNSIGSPLWFDTKLNRGLADFNVEHNFVANYIWELETPTQISGWRRSALGGWQLGGIFEASTGVPFTPGFSGDALGVKSADPNIDVPNLLTSVGCGSLVNPGNPAHYIKTKCFSVPSPITLRGNLGRNTLIGPGLVNLDFSVLKNNNIKKISDAFNVQLRAEFFNVLNHTNFTPPLENRNVFDSSGHPIANAGLITSTQTPSRQIQFALKLIW